MNSSQQYCLRWNNHRTNLLSVFDELLQNEAFTDVTLFCENGSQIRCHRMVLAACSPYFQNLFTELPCKHPVVVLKDVKYTEIKAILEYMYRGEVNVAQDQLAALLKVAEALKVKGLVEENRSSSERSSFSDEQPNSVHSPSNLPCTSQSSSMVRDMSPPPSSAAAPPHNYSKIPYSALYKAASGGSNSLPNPMAAAAAAAAAANSRLNMGMWAVPGLSLPPPATAGGQAHPVAAAAAMLTSCYEAAAAGTSGAAADMSPLRRKKLSSLLLTQDTPILRTVLGQGQCQTPPEVSQPVSLVCHGDMHDSNGPIEDRMAKKMKNEPLEDAQSPYTDFTIMNDDEDKSKLAITSSSPLSYTSTNNGGSNGTMNNGNGLSNNTNGAGNSGSNSGIATYVPPQKPEWKRYKQYTRNDIMSAIEAVRNGMSALQAARKYRVPSRTLYDKVKKLGITTSRPFKRGSNGSNSVCFPYHGGGSSYGGGGHLSETDDSPSGGMGGGGSTPGGPIPASILDATFLQQALDRSGAVDEKDTLAVMAAAAAHHAQVHAAQQQAAGNSPPTANASPMQSPPHLKGYSHHNSMTPSPTAETNGSSDHHDEEDDDDEDQVEDLSISGRKHVIVSPINIPLSNQVSTIKKKEELLKEMIKDELKYEEGI